MTRDEMIEKAAIAIYDQRRLTVWRDWATEPAEIMARYRKDAEAALTAVIPGIMAGTHVEAPRGEPPA